MQSILQPNREFAGVVKSKKQRPVKLGVRSVLLDVEGKSVEQG